MPRVSLDELDQLRQAAAERNELRSEVDEWRRADSVVAVAREALRNADMLTATEEDARARALVDVTAAERERLTQELARGIKSSMYDELAAEVRATEGPKIIADLRSLFETDGTFTKLSIEVKRDIRVQIQDAVLEEERAEVHKELSEPESIAAIKASFREELLASSAMDEFREGCVRDLRQGWNEEVRGEAQAQIESEEAAREAEYKELKRTEWLESSWARDLRDRLRRSLEEEWSGKLKEEVADAIHDEVLKALLEETAELAKEQLEKENRARKLLNAFEGEGVEVAGFEKGTRVEIYLGSRKVYELDGKDERGYGIKVKKQGVACRRKLTLLARDDETFIVDDDSLLGADNEYSRDNAIHRGTIISVGRRVKINGNESLENVIVAGVPLYYDDDTSEPHITDAKYPVADIRIDGLSARSIEHVEMV